MAKKKLLYHPDTKLYEIDGKFYDLKRIKYKKIGKVTHEDVHVYEEINVEKLNKLIESISNKLKDNVDPKRVIEEVLKGIPEKALKKLKEKLEKKKTKVSTQNGCYGIEIDTGKKHSEYLSIFE